MLIAWYVNLRFERKAEWNQIAGCKIAGTGSFVLICDCEVGLLLEWMGNGDVYSGFEEIGRRILRWL